MVSLCYVCSFPTQLPLNSADETYELHVTGHSQDGLLFSNSTRLSFNTKRMSVLIQTDKAFYKPKQEVKFRVLTLLSDFKPYKTPVNIFIKVSGRQKQDFQPLHSSCLESSAHVISTVIS